MNEDSGNIACDIAGASSTPNNAVLSGGAVRTDGYNGNFAMTGFIDSAANKAIRLDGTDDYLTIGASASHAPANNNFYFEAWLKDESAVDDNSPRTIAERESTWRLTMYGPTLAVRLWNAATDDWTSEFRASDIFPAKNTFFHLQVTVSNLDNKLRFFVDGVEKASFDVAACMPLMTDADSEIFIGAYKSGSTFVLFYMGIIDNVKIGDLGWTYNPTTQSGYFRLPKSSPFWGDGLMAPINYHALRGSVYLSLYDYTGDLSYKNRAEWVANLIKSNFQIKEVDADIAGTEYCVWNYWPLDSETYNGFSLEDYNNQYTYNTRSLEPYIYQDDLGHFKYSYEFINACYERGILFTCSDMEKIARAARDKKTRDTPEADGTFKTGNYFEDTVEYTMSWSYNTGIPISLVYFHMPGVYSIVRGSYENAAEFNKHFFRVDLAEYYNSLP